MAQSIPSVPLFSPLGIWQAFFHSPTVGHFPKKSAWGWGIVKSNSVFRTFKLAYGSTPICANYWTIVSTCEQKMTKRRKCMAREKVAVLAVKSDLSYYRSYKNTLICEWLLFSEAHHGAFVHVSCPIMGHLPQFWNQKTNAPGRGGGVPRQLCQINWCSAVLEKQFWDTLWDLNMLSYKNKGMTS